MDLWETIQPRGHGVHDDEGSLLTLVNDKFIRFYAPPNTTVELRQIKTYTYTTISVDELSHLVIVIRATHDITPKKFQ